MRRSPSPNALSPLPLSISRPKRDYVPPPPRRGVLGGIQSRLQIRIPQLGMPLQFFLLRNRGRVKITRAASLPLITQSLARGLRRVIRRPAPFPCSGRRGVHGVAIGIRALPALCALWGQPRLRDLVRVYPAIATSLAKLMNLIVRHVLPARPLTKWRLGGRAVFLMG